MKTMQKLLALTLALVMVLGLAITASAATITIDKGIAGAEYAAYKLLNATDGGEGKFAYTLNETYAAALAAVTGEEDEADIVAYIADLTGDAIQDFADAVYAQIKDMTPDYKTANDKFENVAQGYYLIAETKTGSDADTYSLVMLDTAGEEDITIDTKEGMPTLEKKVKETNDSTGETSDWQDAADYDIGDAVPFKLTGTVSDKIANYKTYYYAFHDTMEAGLTFDPDSVVVTIDGEEVDPAEYTVEYPAEDGHTFDVYFLDLLALEGFNITASTKVVVTFEAELNEDAVHGMPGNHNEAYLEYTNSPYYEGDGENKPGPEDTGHTPEDKVVVFTYKLIANKVDGKGEALEGAGFTLYKYDAEAEDYVIYHEEVTGLITFEFQGMDAGQYKLVETTVPAGYNKAEDVFFTVEATYEETDDDPVLLTLVVKDVDGNLISEGEEAVFATDISEGSLNTNVINLSGTELPSTGGIGTTIFYVLGAVLVLGAAVLLVTKKRMAA